MKNKYFILISLIALSQIIFSKEVKVADSIFEHPAEVMYSEEESTPESKIQNVEKVSVLENENFVQEELFEFEEFRIDGEGMYNLYINGRGVSRTYPVHIKDREIYLSLYDFIDLLGIKDYNKKNGILIVKMGIDSIARELDLNTKDVEKKDRNGKRVFKRNYSEDIIKKNGVLYIKKSAFEEIFDSIIKCSDENLTLNINTKFETPEDIEVILQNKINNITEKKESSEILYTSEKEMFTLGNTRVGLTQDFTKNSEEKKFKTDWAGNLEYSGGVLYGNFTTSYNLKEKEFGSAELVYKDVWKGHTLTVGRYPTGRSSETGLRFEKERGYFAEGREVIIRERVPIGSTVELIYLGTAIDIQTAEDGYAEFRNIAIQLDRTYFLKIYTPTGEIETREIRTARTYNQQDKGEIEYSINWREDKNTGEYKGNVDFYYGVTEHLTLSSGFSRNPIDITDRKSDKGSECKFDDRVRGEVIYTNYLYSFPYTISLNTEKALSNYEQEEKKLENLYTVGGMGTITLKDLRFEYKEKYNGAYFDEKKVQNYNVTYELLNNVIELVLDVEVLEKYNGEKETRQEYGINVARSFGNYSIMGEYTRTTDKENVYRGDLYYNGFEKVSVRVSGEYKEGSGKSASGKEKDTYEGKIALRNKGWNDKFDFSVEAKYRNTGESAVGLSFSMKVDDWFVANGSFDKAGNQRLGVGIDKVFSLKNPMQKITDINSSRVKIKTFLDSNRNNIWDEDEEIIPEMTVKIGDKEIVTDENGIGYIYGLSNGIQYEVKAELNRPEHHLSYSSMKVLPKSVSEIDVDIPIQPFVTLEGYISLDGLNLNDEDAIDVYNNIIVTVLDETGKELEHTIPEDNGGFQVSGLFSEKYKIKIKYLGAESGIEEYIETVELAYGVPDKNRYVFNLSDRYSMLKKDVIEWDLYTN